MEVPIRAFERGTGVRGDAPAANGARQLGARAGWAAANPIRRSTSHESQAEMSCAVARPMRSTGRGSQVVTIPANASTLRSHKARSCHTSSGSIPTRTTTLAKLTVDHPDERFERLLQTVHDALAIANATVRNAGSDLARDSA
jgi:hypothetical protein